MAHRMTIGQAALPWTHDLSDERDVGLWNERFSLGQEVAVPIAMGGFFATTTNGAAFLQGEHALVNIPVYGDVPLHSVTPLKEGTLAALPD